MAVRQDGKETNKRLLKAASEVFAEKGYRDTTVADISGLADANVAAVNYHFGSKDELYAAVWKHAFSECLRVYPADGGVSGDADAPERLYRVVRSFLHRMLDNGRMGHAGRILLREISEPTAVIKDVRRDAVQPIRKLVRRIVQELLGPGAGQREVSFCEMSVIHQCLGIGFRKDRIGEDVLGGKNPYEVIEALAEHITNFSLAGIKAVREAIGNEDAKVYSRSGREEGDV